MAPAKERHSCSKRYGLRSRATRKRSVIRNGHASESRRRKRVKPVRHHRMQITHAKSHKAPQGSSSLHNMEDESSHAEMFDEDHSVGKYEFHTLNSNDVHCTICLDTVTDDYRLEEINACKHRFHKNCLQNWMRENKICPVCRTTVPIYIFSDNDSETKNNNESKREINEGLARPSMPLSESALNYAYMQILDNLDYYQHGSFTTEYVLY